MTPYPLVLHCPALGVVLPIAQLCSLDALKVELPSFTVAVAGTVIAGTDTAAFTEHVLAWWRSHAAQLGGARLMSR